MVAFARGRACVAAGFDAVEVHGCHGYLLCQFASPSLNNRQDEYGGDLCGRFRCRSRCSRGARAGGSRLTRYSIASAPTI